MIRTDRLHREHAPTAWGDRGVRPLARMLVWCGPVRHHTPPPAARTYDEFPEKEAQPHSPDAYWRNDAPLYARPGLTHEQACALHTMLDHYGNDPRMRCLVELLPEGLTLPLTCPPAGKKENR